MDQTDSKREGDELPTRQCAPTVDSKMNAAFGYIINIKMGRIWDGKIPKFILEGFCRMGRVSVDVIIPGYNRTLVIPFVGENWRVNESI